MEEFIRVQTMIVISTCIISVISKKKSIFCLCFPFQLNVFSLRNLDFIFIPEQQTSYVNYFFSYKWQHPFIKSIQQLKKILGEGTQNYL